MTPIDGLRLLDTAGKPTTIAALNATAIAWHVKYGDLGEFWPDGRPTSTFMSGACRQGWHRGCRGIRAKGHATNAKPRLACECPCHRVS